MDALGNSPFFTLTQLQEALDISDRRNLRDSTVGKGAPFAAIGRETVFVTDLFVSWLRDNIQRRPAAE